MSPSLFASLAKSKIARLERRWVLLCLLLLEVAIYWLDEYTGPLISFAPFYIFPVVISASLLSRPWALLFVILSSLARVQVFSQLFPAGSVLLIAFDIFQSFLLYAGSAILVIATKKIVQRLFKYTYYLENHVRQMRQQRRLKASIRRALPEDADDIVRIAVCGAKSGGLSEDILNAVMQKTLTIAFKQGIIDGNTVRDVWTGGKQKVPVEFWVSIINGRMAGFFMLYGVDDQHGSERELHAMVVSDEYLGLGVGAAMTDFFCMHFKNRRLFAACKPGSKMLKMLKHRGFSFFSATDNDYVIIERHN
jgi:ribosomal protein S18 acetylase RimI-like enzyme